MSDQLVTGNSFSRALFFGQDALPELVAHAADYPLGVLIMLIACKALAYGLSLSAFRGGPRVPVDVHRRSHPHRGKRVAGDGPGPAIGMGIDATCDAQVPPAA
jgi:hypothetical protein